MENLTIAGMRELNQRLSKIEHSLDEIAESLNALVKARKVVELKKPKEEDKAYIPEPKWVGGER